MVPAPLLQHQPDLNVANPKVQDEVAKAMDFWLQVGLDGFRADAVPYFLATTGQDGTALEEFADPHAYLRALRSFLGRRKATRSCWVR